MSLYYDHAGKPLSCEEHAAYLKTPEARDNRIGFARVNGNREVSTVWLFGINHQHGDGPPLLYETMIFNLDNDDDSDDNPCWRYTTREQAEFGHAAIVAELTGGRRDFAGYDPLGEFS